MNKPALTILLILIVIAVFFVGLWIGKSTTSNEVLEFVSGEKAGTPSNDGLAKYKETVLAEVEENLMKSGLLPPHINETMPEGYVKTNFGGKTTKVNKNSITIMTRPESLKEVLNNTEKDYTFKITKDTEIFYFERQPFEAPEMVEVELPNGDKMMQPKMPSPKKVTQSVNNIKEGINLAVRVAKDDASTATEIILPAPATERPTPPIPPVVE